MNHCKTCRFWPASDLSNCHPNEVARITEVEKTSRVCTNPKLNGEITQQGALADPSTAAPDAADNYGICFITGSEFGCIHWESKP